MRAADEEDLTEFIYPGIASDPPPPPEYFLDRMILAPRNVDVFAMNERMIESLTGEERVYYSADMVVSEPGATDNGREDYPPEFLRAINLPGMPPGELKLKLGCPVILLRNLNTAQGLCNGTRMIITHMGDYILQARLIGGDRDGDTVLIPRIAVKPSETNQHLNFQFSRRQFPIQLTFALTINKAQGQSVKYVGLDLRDPVFSHGQLYVALSRVTASHNIRILLPEEADTAETTNVVYKDVLI
jgi:hypothetical protein